jgi:sugar/nucleoside kinase (ribokinase family)
VPGGVGRNIAEAAARMLLAAAPSSAPPPAFVSLISVVGADAAGAALRASCDALAPALDASGVATAPPGARTPTVVAVLDPGGGEVAACVADATATEKHLPAERVRREVERRLGMRAHGGAGPMVVVLDGNLSPEALMAGAKAVAAAGGGGGRTAAAVALFEPVSAPKAARGVSALPWLAYASPNAGELQAMARALLLGQQGVAAAAAAASSSSSSSFPWRDRWLSRARRRDSSPPLPPPPDQALRLVRAALPDALPVLRAGLGCLLLTLGEHGAALLTLHGSAGGGGGAVLLVRHVPALPASRVASTSGAGDCLVAGFAVALSSGAEEEQEHDPEVRALAMGAAAATRAVESERNVPCEPGVLEMERLAPLARGLAQRVGVVVLPCGGGEEGWPRSRL